MEKHVNIGINKIKELEFSLKSTDILNIEETIFNFNFNITTQTEIEKEIFEIQVGFNLHNPINNELLLYIKVSNKFLVQNLKQFSSDNGQTFNIPDPALVAMLSLSISHTRALLAKNTSGTSYENFYIPIVNPNDVAKQVFNLKN